MYTYPKNIQTAEQLLQKWSDAGMRIDSMEDAKKVLCRIGYYRLKGYCFHLYDPAANRFRQGTDFSHITDLYQFDFELSQIVFGFISQIEVSLRARLVNSLLLFNDALILNDPSVFSDKECYWKNQSSIASEIARSNDVFIKHNFDTHDGAVPIWAVVEVMSFGTLSKVIKNLKQGSPAYHALVQNYRFKNASGNLVSPSRDMFTSWVQAVVVMRNICAHNSRIYNRVISTFPQLIQADAITPRPRYNGLYQILLAMKYLRPTDEAWNSFSAGFHSLLTKYSDVTETERLNLPVDWDNHFQV